MNELITDNIGLVYHIVKHDFPKYAYDEDVIQSGLLGLVKCAKRYDPDKGSFSNYARNYIKGEIWKELKSRIPESATVSLEDLY